MNEKNPTLCIVAGPNGSGKTSTTVQLLHNEWAENSLYINPDNIAQEQYGDWNSPVAVLKAAELATKMRYECLRKRQDFVLVDRVYVYDNSIENQIPRLLFRTVNGTLFKQYVEEIPQWAQFLIK